MKTVKELDAKISSITNNISQNHPELLNYLNEMPITIPNEINPQINSKVFTAYYNSLQSLLKK